MKSIRRKNIGIVYLVGAGPGDPGLLTLKAKDQLERADVVFYDHLVNPEIFDFCPRAKLNPVGKRGYHDHFSQEKIVQLLIRAARRGRTVVRLKGGDPFIFGRGGEEAEALRRAGIPFEIVPGVTSAIAVPAYAGIPLTHRRFGSSVTLLTGHEAASPALDWSSLAKQPTLVFLMGLKPLAKNFSRLMEAGRSPRTPAALIEWGSYPRQRTVVGTLKTLPELARRAKFESPAIAVVGEVVKLRRELRWYEAKPLFGKKILVTRAAAQASELSRRLREAGAEAMELPTLEILPPRSWRSLDRAIAKLSDFAWILFTSVHAVDFFFARLAKQGQDLRALGGARLAAVGPVTAERLRARGLKVQLQPREFTSESLAKSFPEAKLKGKRLLLPRAEQGREEALRVLRRRGALVEVAVAYRSAAPKVPNRLLQQIFATLPPDLLTFASGATARNFATILKNTPYWRVAKKIPVVVMGPVTRAAARGVGLKVAGMPKRYTIENMVEEIIRVSSLLNGRRTR